MPDPKIRIAVLFGGRSGEHDVSCNSAASILTYLDRQRYEIMPVRISKGGVWTSAATLPELPSVAAMLQWLYDGLPAPDDATAVGSMLAMMDDLARCDLVFPALHGPYGEDGTVQAVFDGFGIPFVGNGLVTSAVSMDKEWTKKVATSAGLTVADGVVLRRGEYDVAVEDRDRLGLPVFVKPAREGSSIGVSKVDDWADLRGAVDRARGSGEKVLVETAVMGREVDIGVLERPGGELEVSPPLECLHSGEHAFFDYRAKYGDATTVLDVPAKLDPAITHGLGEDALRLFRALDCTGLLRVDFFVRPDGTRVLNEVNTFPGMTSYSRYPRMMAAAGLPLTEVIDRIVSLAWNGRVR